MREQDLKLAKVKKSCKTAKTVCNVFKIIVLVGAIVCIVGAVVCFCLRDTINATIVSEAANVTFSNIETNGIFQLSFDPHRFVENGLFAQLITVYCSIGAISCFFVAFIFSKIRKIFLMIEKSESPFTENIMKELKKTFIMISVLTALFMGIGSVVIMALVFWCIYCIMDYGTAIQIEIDETL